MRFVEPDCDVSGLGCSITSSAETKVSAVVFALSSSAAGLCFETPCPVNIHHIVYTINIINLNIWRITRNDITCEKQSSTR